ncbi:MAG: hypothetical protein Q8O15_04820 [Rectinemataceae bacterium]|nr:hypothetical protein [Rectinemataceae bacterium]
MHKNEGIDSLSGQRTEMTFVELIALFVRKRWFFLILFAALAILLGGGAALRNALSPQTKAPGISLIAKIVVIDPYFNRAGEFSASIAASDAAAALVREELGDDAGAMYRSNVTADFDVASNILSVTIRGSNEEEARRLALSGASATRNLLRGYGSGRYEGIVTRMETAAASMPPVPKDTVARYFEDYAQTIASRIEIKALIDADLGFETNALSPYSLLAHDLTSAIAKELEEKSKLEAYTRRTGINLQEAVALAEGRSGEILRARAAILREVLPAAILKFDIIDITVHKIAFGGARLAIAFGLVAALFLAVTSVLIIGYIERVKANPEAMRLIRESRARPSRKGEK